MKILNLYAGIGGNRKLWGGEHEITAVEIVPEIAEIYKDIFPNDTVIVGDAHEYLRQHFREFDFIWSSPPCPTHSVLQMTRFHSPDLKYPDMTLYQEIILLKHFARCKWVVENVHPYYKPLIDPSFEYARHDYWTSGKHLILDNGDKSYDSIRNDSDLMEKAYGYDLKKYNIGKTRARLLLRNAVKPEDGLYVFEQVFS